MNQEKRTAGGNHGSFILHDDAFKQVIGDDPQLTEVVKTDAHEGPVYVANEDALYFTSVQTMAVPLAESREVSIRRVQLKGHQFPVSLDTVTTVRRNSNMANGMILDVDDTLLICEQGTRSDHGRISRMTLGTGMVETVVAQ